MIFRCFLHQQSSHPIHVEAKSTIQTWNNNQAVSSTHHHRSILTKPILHIHGQAKVDTWQTIKRRRSLTPPDHFRRSSPIFVDPKPTLDNWNSLPTRNATNSNDQMSIQPMHIDSHSRVDTWSNHAQQRRSPTNFIEEKPSIIHYDRVKSTVDNWQETKRSKRRIRPKLLQVDITSFDSKKIDLYLCLDT